MPVPDAVGEETRSRLRIELVGWIGNPSAVGDEIVCGKDALLDEVGAGLCDGYEFGVQDSFLHVDPNKSLAFILRHHDTSPRSLMVISAGSPKITHSHLSAGI
jgi:hypothetical protein